MTSEAVDTLMMAPIIQFLGAVSVIFFKAYFALHAFTHVTSFVADSFREIVHGLLQLWGFLELSKEFSISMTFVAFKAVHASISTFFPLGMVTGFWILNAGLAVLLTPAEVAGLQAWFSGHMALDAVSASAFALLHVTALWASVLIALCA